MAHKMLVLATVIAFWGSVKTPLFAIQMQDTQMLSASQADKSQAMRDAEILNHQHRIQALIAKLNSSFQAVADATNENGYVRDRSIVEAHEADIIALRNVVRNQRLFLFAYEHKCGVGVDHHDHIIQLQQQLKAVLYDAVDTFSVYQASNDSVVESSRPLDHVLDRHRKALEELSDAVAQHERAMGETMRACTQ